MAPPKITVFDCYATLDVSPWANKKTIQIAYHRLARERHPDRNGNSAEATANFQKLAAAYEVLTDIYRRMEYDISAEQEYARMQGQWDELQKVLRNKFYGAAAVDAELLSDHMNITRLAQSMGGLVRELKNIPDGQWVKREQQHQARVAELRNSILIYMESLKIRSQHILKLESELAQERKKARDAETRYANLTEALRNELPTCIHVDRLRKALGTLNDESTPCGELGSLCLSDPDESVKAAEGSGTEPTDSDCDCDGGESTERMDQDTPMV